MDESHWIRASTGGVWGTLIGRRRPTLDLVPGTYSISLKLAVLEPQLRFELVLILAQSLKLAVY